MSQKEAPYTPELIQEHLRKAGITQKQIAGDLGVSEMAVSLVINFRSVSQRIMAEVARRIHAKPNEVFAWYFAHKKPRCPSRALQ